MTESELKLIGAFLIRAFNPQLHPKEVRRMVEETLRAFQPVSPELEAWARANVLIEKSWADGVKYITGKTRLQHAEPSFTNWWKRTGLKTVTGGVYNRHLDDFIRVARGLADCQEKGFTHDELTYLKEKFQDSKKNALQLSPTPETKKTVPATRKRVRANRKQS
jgi:hypothetical protein